MMEMKDSDSQSDSSYQNQKSNSVSGNRQLIESLKQKGNLIMAGRNTDQGTIFILFRAPDLKTAMNLVGGTKRDYNSFRLSAIKLTDYVETTHQGPLSPENPR